MIESEGPKSPCCMEDRGEFMPNHRFKRMACSCCGGVHWEQPKKTLPKMRYCPWCGRKVERIVQTESGREPQRVPKGDLERAAKAGYPEQAVPARYNPQAEREYREWCLELSASRQPRETVEAHNGRLRVELERWYDFEAFPHVRLSVFEGSWTRYVDFDAGIPFDEETARIAVGGQVRDAEGSV